MIKDGICRLTLKNEENSKVFTEGALDKEQAKLINPVTLAFIGDAVYSLYVREKLVTAGGGKAADFQRTASKVVSAHGQSGLLETLIPLFTEEESEIFRRGRNAKKATKSKNASPAEYNRSTGFEAVLGFLYLTGQDERIKTLLRADSEEHYRIETVNRQFKP
jgi:ribonuclease-3 family protein